MCGNYMNSSQSICGDCLDILPEDLRPWKYKQDAWKRGWNEFERKLTLAVEWLKANSQIPRAHPKRIPWGFREENNGE